MWRRISIIIMVGLMAFGFLNPTAQRQAYAADTYSVFQQSDWRGGASAENAADPANKTGWTKYNSKTSNLDSTGADGVKMTTSAFSINDDTDTDFNKGTFTNAAVTGTGAAATLGLNAVYQDPFCSALGEWANLPFTSSIGRVAPLARAGNYIYSLWVSWGNNKSFMRWSIADEKWEVLADIPTAVGLGAALAYDGTDIIYAAVGGNRKEFYAYKISTNTWYAKKDVPTAVGHGGALVVVPSISKVFAFCGNSSSVFYRYNVPAQVDQQGSWTQAEAVQVNVGIGASLIYPGSGNFIYATTANNTNSFFKFDITAPSAAWSSLPNVPFNLTWDSDLCYPGAGNYLYAWNAGSRYFAKYDVNANLWESSYYPASPIKNIELPALPYAFNSRAYLYDPDGSGAELRFLSAHSYSSTYRYYPATKKWREESFVRANPDRCRGATILYVPDDGVHGPCLYYTAGNTKVMYRYYLNFYAAASNLNIAYQWEQLPDMVFSGNTNGVNCPGAKIIYMPGTNYIYAYEGNSYDCFSRFNILTNTWETLAATPTKIRRGGNMATAGGYIYLLSGRNESDTALNKLYRYNPANNTWATMLDCPYGTFNCGSAIAYTGGDYLYILRCASRTNFMRYRISTNTWETRANVPNVTWFGSDARNVELLYPGTGNSLYLINSGCCWYRPAMAIYAISSDSWIDKDDGGGQMQQARVAGIGPSYIYAINDYQGLQMYSLGSQSWVNPHVGSQFIPSRFVYGSVVYKDGYAYLFNNYDSGYALKYSVDQKKWVELIKLPFLAAGPGLRATYPGTGDWIYVLQGNRSNAIWKYNAVTKEWIKLANSPYNINYGSRMVSAVISNEARIYVCPGNYYPNVFLQFVDDGSGAGGGSWMTLTNMLESMSNEANGTCIISSGPYKGVYMLRTAGTVKFTKYNIDDMTWTYKADTPWAISDYAGLFYPGTGDFIYCLKGGGRDFAKYSLSQNAWTILTDASISVSGNPDAFYPGTGDLIYFYLGTNHGQLGINFNRYSISTSRWDEPVQFPGSNQVGAQICPMPSGEEIFYMRGSGSQFYKYNITNTVWYTLNPPPASVTWDARAVYPGSGDYIYVTRGDGYYDIWKYSVSTDLWTNLSPPPLTFSTGQAMAYKDNYLYVMRGGSTTTFWRYSIADNAWRQFADAPTSVSRGSNLISTGTDKFLYATAGGGSTAFWRYNADLTDSTNDADGVYNTWQSLAPLPMPSSGGVIFSPGFGDYIYYFVSYSYDISYGTNYFYRYCISTNTWDLRPDLPFVLNGQTAATYPGTGDYIYLASGYNTSSLMKYLLFSSGDYISNIKEIGNNAGFGNATWIDNGLGQIDLKVRTGKNSDLSDASGWSYVSKVNKNSDLSSYAGVKDKDQFLQYRLRFFCYDLSQVPQLDKVTLNYQEYPLSQELVSSAYNTTYSTNRLKNISWTPVLPAGTDVRFQVHTAPDNNGQPGTWGPWYGPGGVQQIPYEFTNSSDYANTSEVVVAGNGTAKLSKVLQDYLYRQQIIVDNSADAQAYSNCTIKIDIPATNIDFWNHISSDGSDIRFVDTDGKTPLKYRVLGFNKSKKSATCWVTVPTVPSSATKTIYLLYGKSTASSESDSTLAESLIGTDFYGFMLAFFDIVTTDAPNRVTIDKLDASGQVVASVYRDFTAVGEKQRYDDSDLTVYHITSQKPITVFSSSVEPASSSDDDFYVVCGNDLWLWCPSNNYDGDVIITAYNDDTQVKITDYGLGDDTQTLGLDKGNFWFGWNRVDSRGEVWHIESTKPITVMAGLINHGDASEQIRSPDMKEYYFYCPDAYLTLTAYEDGTNIIIDNLDSVSGDYSGTLNKGQSYKHIPNPPTGTLSMRTYIWADKPICVVADDMNGGKGQIYQSADTLVGVGKEYYMNTAGTRYLRLVAFEDGGTNITITGDVSPSPYYASLGSKGASVAVDPGNTWRNLQLIGNKKFGLYSYNNWSEAITPVFKVSEFNYRMPTYMVASESSATSTNPALSGWQYKETINVDNTSNDASLTDFQVYVDIDKNHKDFWQHVKNDGSDVRFVDSDDSTILSYYADSFDFSQKTARFWIKLPALSNTVKKTVYMYYGKSAATSQSSGDSVFEFFDGFDGGLGKWDTQYCNLVTISSIFGMDSSAFIVNTGAQTPSTNVIIPSGVVSGRTYDWYWELRWPNNALVDSEVIAQPFTLLYGLTSMTDGPFMTKNINMPAAVSISNATWSGNVATITTSAAHNLVLPTATSISTATWSNNVATFTTSAAHGLLAGDRVTVSGVTITAYNGLYTVSQVLSSTSFTVALQLASDPGAGSSGTVLKEVAAPRVVIAGVTPTAYNGTYIVTQVQNATKFKVSLPLGSDPGNGSGGTMQAGQMISGIGGNFVNNESNDLLGLKFRFSFTDVDTGISFSNIDSTSFDLRKNSSANINNLSIVMPPGLVQGHLYYWSWNVLDINNNTVFSSGNAPSPLFNIAVGFSLSGDPVLPTVPIVGGTTRSVSGNFNNTSGVALNNLFWRFTLTDTSQGGRTTVKVGHNGYLQGKTNMSPNYNITTQVVWQAANKTGRHFLGIGDPNAKYATDQGNVNYLAGYDVLMNNNGYFYDESGNGYTSWESIRMAYTANMWNTEKMTWTPHNPGGNPPTTGKVVFELSSGDKLPYNAGFVAGPNLSIKPIVRSSLDSIYVDKFMVYKSANVTPYVGFTYSETANPTGMEVYYKTNPTIQPILGVFYDNNLVDFTNVINTPANTNIKYQISSDGYNWYWFDGANWTKVSGGFSQTNTAQEIKNNLASYLVKFPSGEFWYRAYLNSTDGINTPELDNVTVTTTTSPTYYITPAGSLINFLNRDTVDDQWFQYKAIFSSVGQETPKLTNTNVEYIKSYVQMTYPNGGETLNSGQTVTITWNSQAIDGATGKVKLQYSVDDGANYTNIASNLANTGSYDWLLPDNPSQTAKIKVISEDFPGVYDASDASFKILAVQVTSPNGGEIWEAGKNHDINWSASGTLSHDLTIKYSKDGGATWNPVSSNRPPSPPKYSWSVQNDPADAVLIKIYDPTNLNITDTSNNTFAIVPVPKITINSPQAGDVWKQGLNKTLSWTANQNWLNSTVDIEYSNDDFVSDIHSIATGISIGTPVGNNPNDDINGSYDWTVPNAFSDSVKVRVKESALPPNRNGQARDTQQIVKGSSGAFTITAPTITFTKPTATDVLIAAETYRVTWLTDGYVSNGLLLEYTKDGTNWATIAQNVSNENKYYDWLVPAAAVGDSVMIKITDQANTQVTTTSGSFKVLSYPAIKVLAPNGSDNLVIGEQFNIKWQSWGSKMQQGGSDYQAIKISYSSDNGATWHEINNQQANDGDYPWEVPDAETTQALIKVEDENDPLIFDISDAPFNIMLPSITLTSPNGGESWFATGVYNITWTSRGYINPNSLKFEYSTDGTNWTLIKAGEANDGVYSWTVANIVSNSVRVRVTDALRTTITDTSDNVFEIKAPTITVDQPKGGEEWVAGVVNQVKWSCQGKEVGAIRDDITIQYSTDGGTSWTDVATGETNAGTYQWLVPSTVSNTCLVKVFDATRPATVGISPENFKIVLPYIRVLTPNGAESWPIGTTDKLITFRSVGDISNNLKIEYSKDNFTSDLHTIATGVSKGQLQEDSSYLGSYTWNPIPDDYSGSVKVRITDANWPAIYDQSDNFFTIAYPIVRVTRPNGGNLFTVGDTEAITWSNEGTVGNSLKLEYSKDNFATAGILINANVANSGAGGSFNWTVPNDLSTVVRVRATDNNRPVVFDKSDANFSILPFPTVTISKPNGAELWRVGTNQDITWSDNGGLVSNNLTLQYSVDGGTNWKGIATGVANSGKYTWKIPDDISATCKVRITDAGRVTTTDTSDDSFEIAAPLITLTSPNGGELWAVGDSANVTWTTEGGVSDSLLMEFSPDGGSTYYFVATVQNTGSYLWTVPDYITSNALFRIKDTTRPATIDTSDRSFTINPLPTITITSPNGGETFVLGDEMNITWTWTGLSISNNLVIEMSVDNFATRQVVATGVANTGSYTWAIPESALTGSTLKLRITDGNRTVINDTSNGYFRIRGGFAVSSPNGNENWVAKSPQTISWTTRGSIPRINLDYTTNDGQTWNTIASGITNQNTYSWVLPDIKSNSVKVRISNQDDSTVTDESNNSFNIIYASVKFNVLDFDTYQHLTEVAAEEPSTSWTTGYELSSPITKTAAYPYGTYTTFFKKANFIDNSVTWTAPRSGTEPYVVTLYLESTASAQVTWEAIFTYSYAPADDSLSAVGSLQRKGKLVGTRIEERDKMGVATLKIYEPNGTTVKRELTSLVNESGMYVFPVYVNTAFESGKVYPATLTIVYNDVNYTSSANIDVGSEKLQYEFFTKTASQLATSVATIENAVAGGTAQTRADIEEARGKIVTDLSTTKTDIKAHVDNVLTTTEQRLNADIQAVKDQTEMAMKSEILNTEGAVKTSDTIIIRYRTYSGLSPTIDVYNAKNNQVVNKGKMTEVKSTGIYEYSLKFQNSWGKGTFSIVCSESTKGSLDALAIEVISSDIDSVSGQVSAILGSTSSINSLKEVATVMGSQFNMLESVLTKISRSMVDQVKTTTASINQDQMTAVFDQLSEMSQQLKQIRGESAVNLEKLYTVSADKKSDFTYLKNKTQELKASVELSQKLVENIANKPVTQTWYEYR